MLLRRKRLLWRAGSLAALVLAVAGCTKGGAFDPTTMLDNDMFDSKPVVSGKRQPVFPNGVPGAATGIPPDLVKGYQPPPEQTADPGPAAPGAATPEKPTAELKPKVKPKVKPRPRVARAAPPRTEIDVGMAHRPAAPAQPQTAWPAPPPAANAAPQPAWPSPTAAQPSQPAWPSPTPGTATQ